MAKKTYDELVIELTTVKETLKGSREELRSFKNKHELKGDAKPKSAKDKKILATMNNSIETLVAKRDSLAESVKELKPKKERVSKYTYPLVTDGKKKRKMDDNERKKYRAKMRAGKKKAVKANDKPSGKKKAVKANDKPSGKKKAVKAKKG